MNEELIKFIELCLMDGVISDKEREVIFRKSKELGVPDDECEILIDSLVSKYSKKTSPPKPTKKKGGFFSSMFNEIKKNIDTDSIKSSFNKVKDDIKKGYNIEKEKIEKELKKIREEQNKTTSSNKPSKTKITSPKSVNTNKPSSSKFYSCDEVDIIVKYPESMEDGRVYDLSGNRVYKISKTMREKSFKNKSYLGRKEFDSGTIRWVEINPDEVENKLNDSEFIEVHSLDNKLKTPSKKKVGKEKSIETIKEEGELFSIDFYHVFETEQVFDVGGSLLDEGKKIKLTYETWRVKKDSIVIYKLDNKSKDSLDYFLNPLKKYKKYESDYRYSRFNNKLEPKRNRKGDTIFKIENTELRWCDHFLNSKEWNDLHFGKYCKKLLNKFQKQIFTFSKIDTIRLNQFDFKTKRVFHERNLKIFGTDYVKNVIESGGFYDTFQKVNKVHHHSRFYDSGFPISPMCLSRNIMFPYDVYLEIKTNIDKYDSYEIYCNNNEFEFVEDKIGIEQYYTDSFLKLKILIEKGYDIYLSYTNGELQSSQSDDLDQFKKGETSLILDFDIYFQIVKNNQEKIIKKDDQYVQKFIKLNNHLKEKYQNLDNILRKLKINIKVRKKEDFFENEKEVNFFKGLVYSYNLLVNHSIVMVTSLVEKDMITFYEFYEVFDKMNVFDTNWENELNEKLSKINESLVDLNFSVLGLMSQMRSMEKKIVTQLQSINTSIGSLEDSVNKQLSETNSRLKYENLTSYYKKSTLKGSMDWFDGPSS